MKSRILIKTIVAVVLISGSLTYFIYHSMQSSWVYYYSVDEFAAKKSEVKNYSVRIAGKVKPATISRDLKQMNLTFMLAGDTASVPVSYKGVVPDNFTDGREVVVEGHLDPNGLFHADVIITRCESKYRAKVK
jgi:cytochrome c-type biogenesis protein CcmE